MGLDSAIRYTEILLAVALILQSLEHLSARQDERLIFSAQLILSVFLLLDIQTQWICLALIVVALFALQRFQGPYNGGSDRMGLLVLCSIGLVNLIPSEKWQEIVFGYLAIQLLLSYFISGWVKIINPQWRSGQALGDVFQFSAYPVSEELRKLAGHPRLLGAMSWFVILFELVFPLTVMTQITLIAGLITAAIFHFANACLFGLNRFFWIWLAAYPSIVWFQQRMFM